MIAFALCTLVIVGFAYVALDLEGYRTGSMNETLSEAEVAAGNSE